MVCVVNPPSVLYSGTPTPEGLYFTVGSSSGLVEATGTLDREIFSRYTIIVKVITSCLSWLYIHYYSMWHRAEILNSQAYEHPDASTEVTVILHVSDVNEPPQFLRSHYSVSVTEGAGPGDLLTEVEALDRDEVS